MSLFVRICLSVCPSLLLCNKLLVAFKRNTVTAYKKSLLCTFENSANNRKKDWHKISLSLNVWIATAQIFGLYVARLKNQHMLFGRF